jgi:hypothetical protein
VISKVLDVVIGSLEVGLDELLVQPEVDMQVPHQQFEHRVRFQPRFVPQVLHQRGSLQYLLILHVPYRRLVQKQILVC